jgi:hypothetical protein
MKDLMCIVLGLVFSFWRIFASWQPKEQSHCNASKASFWGKKKIAQSHHIMRKIF